MALIRGANGLCPCPICLVPKDEQLAHAIEGYEHRTAVQTKKLVEEASKLTTNTTKEAVLKPYGLREIPVSFFYLKSRSNADSNVI